MLSRILHRLMPGRARDPGTPERLTYAAAVAQARRPWFYLDGAVPDTLDGRYELVVLHVILVMRRLKGGGAAAEALVQRLQEVMVEDFDRTLREFSIGDDGVSRRVDAMLKGFAGRLEAYSAALAADDDHALDVVLDNNLYGTVPDAPAAVRAAIIGYLRRQERCLAEQALDGLSAGRVIFAE